MSEGTFSCDGVFYLVSIAQCPALGGVPEAFACQLIMTCLGISPIFFCLNRDLFQTAVHY